MASTSTDLLEIVLRECARMAPQPLYPGAYAQSTGVDRAALDDCLDQLRLAGLVRLTDWVRGSGQGYTVTPQGSTVLQSTRLVQRLRDHGAEAPVPVLAPVDEERPVTWARGEAVRAVLLTPTRPVVTQILIVANLAVFALGLYWAAQDAVASEYLGFSGNKTVSDIRHELGSLSASDLVGAKQWWRLITYAFVHIGGIHLLMNMLVLHSIGGIVEQMWGSLRYLALYLIAGIGGGVTQVLVDGNVNMAGASGSLCGLLTSMAVWVALNRTHLPGRYASDWMRNIFMNIVLIAFISFLPNVSWAGHLGGGVAGALVAVPLVFSRFGTGIQRWLALLAVLAVPLVCVLLLYEQLFAAPALLMPILFNPPLTTAAWTKLIDQMTPLQSSGSAEVPAAPATLGSRPR